MKEKYKLKIKISKLILPIINSSHKNVLIKNWYTYRLKYTQDRESYDKIQKEKLFEKGKGPEALTWHSERQF